jgi:hypothetical protein
MSNDTDQDKRVSETYRSLAGEQAPPHLDRKVLEMAAAERPRPLYARWVSWTRPVAWAATITLCLAITLELSRDQTLRPATPAASLAPQAAAPKDVAAPELRLEKREQDQALAESINDAIVAEKTALGRSAAKQVINQPAPARVRQSADLMEEVVVEKVDEEKEKATDANLLADASFSAGAMANARDNEANECAGVARTEAESWLECIEALEAAGDNAAAERQRDALKETFPDFKLP